MIEISYYGGKGEFFSCGERTVWQRRLEPLFFPLIKTFLFLKSLYSLVARGEWRKAGRCLRYRALFSLTLFGYDENGRKIEEKTYMLGSLLMKKVFVYDEKGDIAEEVEYAENDSILQSQNYSREYDEQGNWIRETISSGLRMDSEKLRESTVVTERKISYY